MSFQLGVRQAWVGVGLGVWMMMAGCPSHLRHCKNDSECPQNQYCPARFGFCVLDDPADSGAAADAGSDDGSTGGDGGSTDGGGGSTGGGGGQPQNNWDAMKWNNGTWQ